MTEMKIKITMRYHLTPGRMAIMKMATITNVDKDVEKRKNPGTLMVRIYIGSATVETGIEVSHNVGGGQEGFHLEDCQPFQGRM